MVKFRTQSTNEQGVEVHNSIRGFNITVDEPEEAGGTNQGPNPVELLLASFGSCLCVLARSVAKEKNLNVGEVQVDLEGDLDPRGMNGKEGIRPGFQDIKVQMSIEGSLRDADKQEFLNEIESRCPVRDNLQNSVDIQTEVK